MSKTLVDTFVRATGNLGSIPEGQFNFAQAWELLLGNIQVATNKATAAATGNSLAVVNMGLRSNGRADVEVTITPDHVQGNAAYVRVVDANNWIRARVRTPFSPYQYYVTEYQHTTYNTEYRWDQYVLEKEYQKYKRTYQWAEQRTEYRHTRQVSTGTCTYGAWGSYSVFSTTACVTAAPAGYYTNTGNCVQTGQVIYVDAGTSGCASGRRKYTQQARYRTSSENFTTQESWSTSSTPPSGYTYSGQTRTVATGTTTQAEFSPGSNWTYTGQNYYALQGNVWLSVTPTDGVDNFTYSATGNTRNTATGAQAWTSSSTSSPGTGYSYSGNTRQVVGSQIWDQNYEAGAPTRQQGPYNGTNYFYGSLVLERCIGGTVAVLGTWQNTDSTPRQLILSAEGDILTVKYNGTQRIQVTDGSHKTTGKKAGLGAGGSATDETVVKATISSITIRGLSPERIKRSDGTLAVLNRKMMVGTKLIDIDTRSQV